jgi:hypothetical protein
MKNRYFLKFPRIIHTLDNRKASCFFYSTASLFFVENNRSNSEEPADFFYSINQNTLLTRLDLQSAEKIDSQIEKMAEKIHPPAALFLSCRVFFVLFSSEP